MIPSAVPGDHHTTTADRELRDLIAAAIRREDRENWQGDLRTGDTFAAGRTVATVLADAVLAAIQPALDARRTAERSATFHEAARVVETCCDGCDDAVNLLDNIGHGVTAYATPAACTCGAAPVHQHGCPAGQ